MTDSVVFVFVLVFAIQYGGPNALMVGDRGVQFERGHLFLFAEHAR